AGGQVGFQLARALPPPGVRIAAHDRARTDITDPQAVAAAIGTERPAAIINAAAYTAVDRAEEEPSRAYAVNAGAPALLARAAAAAGIPFIHVSTDYVFD